MDKHDAILEAALELFAGRGYHGTAVPLIADRAGVGAGTIYRHFKDKKNLVNELYRHWKKRMFETITDNLPMDLPMRTLFHEIWIRWITFAQTYSQAVLFLEAHHHSPYLDEISRQVSENVYGSLLTMIESGCREQIFKAVPVSLHLSFITGAIHQLLKDTWADRFELTSDIIAQAEEMCWQAIRR